MSASQATAARLLDAGPRYRLLASLGEGSFGAVYRAQRTATERAVAIKALTRVGLPALTRFKREFRALSEVSHPNLVGLRELFEHDGQWFIAMDLVDGTDLLSWVRKSANANGFDEGRLRKTFAEVAQGLAALHGHGLLHRDLKPSNVRVTPEGKAVVLDYGLATMADDELQSTQRSGVGMLGYMAPEQAGGERLTAAADLYALGASLYEALTGKLPFEAETPLLLLLRKTNEEPLSPRQLAPQTPADLDALTMALLERSPRLRPSLEAVLRVLLGPSAGQPPPAPPRASAAFEEHAATFEGRKSELSQLERALSGTHEGEQSLFFIEGESGIGKSALVEEFVRQQLTAQPETWTLHGHCYERERVPYNAFAGCIDALAKRLGELPAELCEAVLPRRAGLLVELFPVLGAVSSMTGRPAHGAPVELTARRLEAFAVLSELLGRLAESRPLVLVIDDLEWADDDSLRLLYHLAHGRPPPVMVVATLCSEEAWSEGLRVTLAKLHKAPQTERLTLRGLPRTAVEALVRKLLGPTVSSGAMNQIAYESAGHPMLVSELSHYVKAHGTFATQLTLDAALVARVRALSPDARRLLELLALCARPQHETALAAWSGAAGFADAVSELLGQRLARRDSSQTLGVAHERVRRAALSLLDPQRARDLHLKIAEPAEQQDTHSPSELADHRGQAGETARAGKLHLAAAELALESLAFCSAAEHYARAFALLEDDGSTERAQHLAQQGRALAGAGRSAEAARVFEQAAERSRGEARVRLLIAAAQHQIQSANFEAGMNDARALLAELGAPLPRGDTNAFVHILWESFRIKLRGQRVATGAKPSLNDKLVLAACASLAFPISWVELLPSQVLNLRLMRRAFACGEPVYVAQALAHEAAFRVLRGGRDEHELLRRSLEIADDTGDPVARSFVRFQLGVVALLKGDVALAREHCEAAEDSLTVDCGDETWRVVSTRVIMGSALCASGAFPRLRALSERWLLEARERGDRLAEAALLSVGFGFMSMLMRDAPTEALEAISQSVEPWRDQPYGFARQGEMYARSLVLAYAGRHEGWAWLVDHAAEHERAFVHRAGPARDLLLTSQNRADLCRYAAASASAGHALLTEIENRARHFSGGALQAPLAILAQAQVHALRSDREPALGAVRQACKMARELGQEAVVQHGSYLLGVLEGGARGRELREAALSFFEERGFLDPWRAATMEVPAARLLEGDDVPRVSPERLLLGRYRLSEALPAAEREALIDARDVTTTRTVTLRILSQVEPTALDQIKEYLRTQGGVHHENLARTEALYEHDGRLIVVLEQVPDEELLEHVRPQGRLDEGRLRSALSQALSALSALHDAGATHGALRASLLRVSEQGRVVILGRSSVGVSAGDSRAQSTDLDYLAPEQLEAAAPSAAADVYALGTTLYQALTGQLPFAQPTLAKLRNAKRRGRAVPPWALRLEVPADVEELCLAMLERDPTLRPSAHAALARLTNAPAADDGARSARRARALASLLPSSHVTASSPHAFVGRAAELTRLREALAGVEQGKRPLVCVEGEGGIGKTSLVNEALIDLARAAPETVILRSRCYANEQLRFQAFDGAIAELARLLTKLPQTELASLLPARAALLAQLFPALGAVPVIRGATKKGLPAEPGARRAAAIEAFIELLARLSQRAPLVLIVDDLQWADGESFALLSALLGELRDLRLGVVAMLRPDEARDASVREALVELLARPSVARLRLDKLSDDDALALARRIFGPTPSREELALAVRESAGHPLFLRELAQARVSGGSRSSVDLEDALLERCAALEPGARLLLDLLALLARPCPAHVLERAAGLQLGFDDALRSLLRSELAQRRGPLGLTCFHDRLREVVAAQVARARRPSLFGHLAEALEAEPEADEGECAQLWDLAGEGARASAAYRRAGDRALEVLSFATAERLYARALTLAPAATDAPLAHLLSQRAHAFVALGQSAQAATLFEQAARQTSGAEAIRLRVWAAQHQIQSAQFEEGLKGARAVLEELGVPVPQSDRGAMTRILWERSLFALRGTNVKVQNEIEPSDKLRLDAMVSLISPICWADFLAGYALNTVHLRQAMALGEPGHVARALSQEAMLKGMTDDHNGAIALAVPSEKLAAQSAVPSVIAFVDHQLGNAAFMRGDLTLALAKCEAAEELFATSCPEEAWALTNCRMTICILLARHGDFPALFASSRRWFSEAEARQDAFATNGLFCFGLGHFAWLMEDKPAELFEVFESVVRPWRTRPPGFAQAGELFVQMNLGAYEGGARAYRWFCEHRQEHARSILLRQGESHQVLLYSRAMAALCARAEASGDGKAQLLREVTATAKRIPAKGFGAIFKPLVWAQIHALEGRTEAALEAARQGLRASQERGDVTYSEGASYLIGVLEGGESGRQRCAASLAFFRERGWKDPWRIATSSVVAVRELEGKLP